MDPHYWQTDAPTSSNAPSMLVSLTRYGVQYLITSIKSGIWNWLHWSLLSAVRWCFAMIRLTWPVALSILNDALSWGDRHLPCGRGQIAEGLGTIDKVPVVRFTATLVACPTVTPPGPARIIPLTWAIHGFAERVRSRHVITQRTIWLFRCLVHALLFSGTVVLSLTQWQPGGAVRCTVSEHTSPIHNCALARGGGGSSTTGTSAGSKVPERGLVLALRCATELVTGAPGPR